MKGPAKYLYAVSGLLYILIGLSISFYPQETGRIFGTASQYGVDLLLMKVVGALVFAFGVTNIMVWRAGSASKAITLGNAMMALIISGQFLKFILSQDGVGGHFWVVTSIFSLFTIGFIYTFFTSSTSP
jgi:hypothetical protein